MGQSGLGKSKIDESLDELEKHVVALSLNIPYSYSDDKSEWAELTRYITHTTRILSRLNFCHNTFVSINQLPPEILLKIFTHLQPRFDSKASLLPQTRDNPWGRRFNDWLIVTKVCRCWRSLAFASPSLWRNIIIPSRHRNPGALIAWFMEQSAPMTFRFFQQIKYPNRWDEISKLLIANSSRVKCMSLTAYMPCTSGDIVEILLRHPFPSLLGLSLHHTAVGSADFTPEVVHLPQQLRQLCISGEYYWPIIKARNLTHLVFFQTSIGLPIFLVILDGCSRLDILHLEDGYPFAGEEPLPPPHSGHATLTHHLKALIVRFPRYDPSDPSPSDEPPSLAFKFLEYLKVSSTTSIYLAVARSHTFSIPLFDRLQGIHLGNVITSLNIQICHGDDVPVLLKGNQLVLTTRFYGAFPSISNLQSHLASLTELHFYVPANYMESTIYADVTVPCLWGEEDVLAFLNAMPSLQMVHFDTPIDYWPLLPAISKSSAPIQEVRAKDWPPREGHSVLYDFVLEPERWRAWGNQEPYVENIERCGSSSCSNETFRLVIEPYLPDTPLTPGPEEFLALYT